MKNRTLIIEWWSQQISQSLNGNALSGKMPYRGSMRKFWLGDKTNCSPINIFTQGIFLPDECYQITEVSGGKSLMPPHEFSIQCPNFKLGVNLRGH